MITSEAIPTIVVPESLYARGEWQPANIGAMVINPDTGDLVIIASTIITEDDSAHMALRLTRETIQKLRILLGFGEPGHATPTNA